MFKHFSHIHGLEFHQMPQGSRGQCSGCQTPVSGNIYACWQCNHFLHEQCFHAARSLKHPSHPPHSLTLVPNPTYQGGSFRCKSCNVIGNGSSYSCAECEFDMHVQCALSPHMNQHISPFPAADNTQSYNQQPQNTAYPQHNTQNFAPQHYNSRPQNHLYSQNNTQSFSVRPQNPTSSIFPGVGATANQHGMLHYPQSNTPVTNYSHPAGSAAYTNHPIRPTTPPSYNSGMNPTTTTATNPPPLPPPFYPTTNQTPQNGNLTNQNNSFPPPNYQQNTTVPNYSPPTSNPYPNHPSQPTTAAGIPTRETMVNPTSNNVVNPPPPQPFYPSPETNAGFPTRETMMNPTPNNVVNPPSPQPVYPSPETNAGFPTRETMMNPTPNNVVNPPPPQSVYPIPETNAGIPTRETMMNPTPNNVVNPPSPQPFYPSPPQSNSPSIIKHFSHPHALKQIELEAKTGKTCSACEHNLLGSSYCCTEPHCSFNLHKACFDSPPELHHKFHLSHHLTLVTSPYANPFTCNACLKQGNAFAYTCTTCPYNLHVNCASQPEKISRPDHEHELTLYYSPSSALTESDQVCDACRNPVHESAWMYYCQECDFGTHIECVASEVTKQERKTDNSAAKRIDDLVNESEQLRIAYLEALIAKQGREYALDLI